RRLGPVVAEAQARLPARAAAADALVAPHVLRQVAHARVAPGHVGALLEPLRLLLGADAGEPVGRVGLVAVLGEPEVEPAALPARVAQSAGALDRVDEALEAGQVGEAGVVGVRGQRVGGTADAVRVVGDALGGGGLEAAARPAAVAPGAAVDA